MGTLALKHCVSSSRLIRYEMALAEKEHGDLLPATRHMTSLLHEDAKDGRFEILQRLVAWYDKDVEKCLSYQQAVLVEIEKKQGILTWYEFECLQNFYSRIVNCSARHLEIRLSMLDRLRAKKNTIFIEYYWNAWNRWRAAHLLALNKTQEYMAHNVEFIRQSPRVGFQTWMIVEGFMSFLHDRGFFLRGLGLLKSLKTEDCGFIGSGICYWRAEFFWQLDRKKQARQSIVEGCLHQYENPDLFALKCVMDYYRDDWHLAVTAGFLAQSKKHLVGRLWRYLSRSLHLLGYVHEAFVLLRGYLHYCPNRRIYTELALFHLLPSVYHDVDQVKKYIVLAQQEPDKHQLNLHDFLQHGEKVRQSSANVPGLPRELVVVASPPSKKRKNVVTRDALLKYPKLPFWFTTSPESPFPVRY